MRDDRSTLDEAHHQLTYGETEGTSRPLHEAAQSEHCWKADDSASNCAPKHHPHVPQRNKPMGSGRSVDGNKHECHTEPETCWTVCGNFFAEEELTHSGSEQGETEETGQTEDRVAQK